MITVFKNYLIEKIQITDEQFESISSNLKVKKFDKNQISQHIGHQVKHGFFVGKGLLRSYSIDAKLRNPFCNSQQKIGSYPTGTI